MCARSRRNKLGETVVSILSGILILRESFSIVQIIGAAVVIVGIYVVNKKTALSCFDKC